MADPSTAALHFRYQRGLEIVAGLSEQERFDLLAAVICPGRALAEASRQAALELLAIPPRRGQRFGSCVGCDGCLDAYTAGCRTCKERHARRQRLAREREFRDGNSC